MLWLIVALSSYFLLALVHIVDKHILGERIPSPQVYAFYLGLAGILILVIAPFGFLAVPSASAITLALMAGVFHILAIFALFIGLKKFETSRIVPAVGALLPLFTFGLTFIFTGSKDFLTASYIIAFVLLISGGFLITIKKLGAISFSSIKIAAVTALLFSLYFVLLDFVFASQPFISGLIWTRIGAFLAALCFLCFKEVRSDLFQGPKIAQKKNWLVVVPNQLVGSGGTILQNWAIALAPLSYLGIINALEGTKYVFLLLFGVLLSLKFPWILKEEISREVILQKVAAILLIGAGLCFLIIK